MHGAVRERATLVPSIPITPHREPAEAVVSALGSDVARGLTGAEAQRRLEQYGPNRLKAAPETPWWTRLLEQFQNVLVIILLVAVVVSMAEWLLQDPRETALPYEAIVIMAIVILNAILGFVQEARAEKSVRALMALAAPEATVVRDGERQRVATHDIVPGDVVLIEAGDKIPADARLVNVANLQTNEAPLTGESVPVSKEVKPLEGDGGLGDRRNMLYSGTVATYGRGRAVVVSTGMATEVGRIAGLLESAEKEPTPLQKELDRTGKWLSAVMLGICALVFAAGLLEHDDLHPQHRPQPVPVRGGAGGRGHSGGTAGDRHRRAQPRRPPHGGSPCDRAQAAGGRNVRGRHRHLLRQDRHAYPQRNDRARHRDCQCADRGRRQRLRPRGRIHDRRQGDRCRVRAPRRARANAACRGAGQRRVRSAIATVTGSCRAIPPRAPWWSPPASSASAELERYPRIGEIPFTSERKRHTTLHLDRAKPGELHVFVKGAPELLLGEVPYRLGQRSDRPAHRRGTRSPPAAQRGARPPGAADAGDRDAHHPGRRARRRPGKPPVPTRSSCRRASRTTSCCSAS